VSDLNEVTRILQQAADLVAKANLPAALQGVAFDKAVDLIAGVATIGDGPAKKQVQTGAVSDSGDALDKIATKLDLKRELIHETFEATNGSVTLTIARSKLAEHKTKGTKQIALLVSAARQAAGIEEWTETKTIRAFADDYGKYDSPNFAAAIAELGDFFSFSGSGANRKLRMRRAGFEEAASLIKKIQTPPGQK